MLESIDVYEKIVSFSVYNSFGCLMGMVFVYLILIIVAYFVIKEFFNRYL